MSGVEAGSQVRGPAVRRVLEAVAEAWRERVSERRARAAPKLGAEPRVERSRLGAALEARHAVRSGVRLDDFLRYRLAKYAGRLPVPLEALPVTVDVEGGEAVVRPRSRLRHAPHGARTDVPDFARALVERDGVYAAREIRDAEAALDRLEARTEAARGRLEALEIEIAGALASGQIVARPDVNATPEQLGRPPVPSAVPIHALRGFVAALLAAEGWRFSAPALAASGVTPQGIEEALRSSPVPTTLALAFALGAAVAAFTFAGVAVARGAQALSTGPDSAGRGLLSVAAAGAALLVPGVAAAAAAPERWALLGLLAAVPFAGAMLWRIADALAVRRGAAAEAALVWDRERACEAVERGRREEIRIRAVAELQGAEAERVLARRRLQQLHRLAIGAERSADLAARAEARRLDRLSEGLACALELDRYLYIRLAAERLQAPLERPSRASRATRLEPAIATERLGVAG
jgi:hypothetical protein